MKMCAFNALEIKMFNFLNKYIRIISLFRILKECFYVLKTLVNKTHLFLKILQRILINYIL